MTDLEALYDKQLLVENDWRTHCRAIFNFLGLDPDAVAGTAEKIIASGKIHIATPNCLCHLQAGDSPYCPRHSHIPCSHCQSDIKKSEDNEGCICYTIDSYGCPIHSGI